jgi:beta-aspartyl-peptidase (threonine type)
MDGATLRFGGIGAVPAIGQPVALARAVLEDGEHALLVGPEAWRFARARGFAPVDPETLITPPARARLAAELERRRRGVAGPGGGTVGACAIDAAGHVAAATSTGGMTGKWPGRVGDAPLPGCGTYADDLAGACSATGTGERILRVTLGRAVVDEMRAGHAAQDAAARAVAAMLARVGPEAGVICVDRLGRVGVARSSESLPHARASLAEPDPVAAP